jgi:hypothetical protein
MSSSLEDRIRLLIGPSPRGLLSELETILAELKAAVRDHIRFLRAHRS